MKIAHQGRPLEEMYIIQRLRSSETRRAAPYKPSDNDANASQGGTSIRAFPRAHTKSFCVEYGVGERKASRNSGLGARIRSWLVPFALGESGVAVICYAEPRFVISA